MTDPGPVEAGAAEPPARDSVDLPVVRGPGSIEDAAERRSAEQWLGLFASVIAPTTLMTALLYYFGYVATYAKFAYFGVDVDALGYASSDYVLRSAAALFVPIMVLLLIGIIGFLGHRLIRSQIDRRRGTRPLTIAGALTVVAGSALFIRGVVGVVDPAFGLTEFPTATPLCLALGAIGVGYGAWALQFKRGVHRSASLNRPEKVVAAMVAGIVVFALFWVTNTVAAAYGRGEAQRIATDLSTRPGVILDTTERLYIPVGSASEQRLPDEVDQQFHYRYGGFRLLTVTSDGWLLMSQRWTQQNGYVLVVPRDAKVRVRVVHS